MNPPCCVLTLKRFSSSPWKASTIEIWEGKEERRERKGGGEERRERERKPGKIGMQERERDGGWDERRYDNSNSATSTLLLHDNIMATPAQT